MTVLNKTVYVLTVCQRIAKNKSYTDDYFVCIAFFVIFIDKIKYLDYNINR